MQTLLPNPDFLKWFIKIIGDARLSIIIVNYLATLDESDTKGPVARIVAALIVAVKRGVVVSVILEGSKFRENYGFYRRLKDGGANVWMDTSLTFIHTKAILIDDKLLCVGSHNLSTNALVRHEEATIVTDDAAAITRFKQELVKMTKQRDEISSNICRDGVNLPVGIIVGNNAPLVKLKCAIAPHAYLLYLLICRLDKGTPSKIPVDADAWAKELGLPSSTASAQTRISSILEMMSQKLCIVKYDKRDNVVIRKKDRSFDLSPLSFQLPVTFWHHNWHTRLSVEAIHLYLAGEAEKLTSPFKPWWRLKRDEIAAKYGFQKQLVGRAQMELKRNDLLEILFETAGELPVGRYARYMNYFRQNPFYDYNARMARIEEIYENHTGLVSTAAKELLKLAYCDMDVDKYATLCGLVSKFGPKKARMAAEKFANLAPNSTKRTFEYIGELICK